ncbi:MAG: PQQ-dependent sugar dehydrogenase, partial [Bacteroidota bacterium]
ISGLTRPVDIDHAGDARLFITEQNGSIRVVDASGNLLNTPFLSLSLGNFTGGNEQGLLGLAFHPDYSSNGFFYINYTDGNGDTVVERYKVSDDDPNVADPNSQTLVIKIEQPFPNHNAGDLNFGPDGYLYVATGDGGGANDPQGNSQKRLNLLGKILRLDVNVDGMGYEIPPDNPFANTDFTLDEIWSLGLRNPWRFSFDQLTGDMWIGDVGQDDWEEIDYQPASSPGGENYGWNCFEGNALFNSNSPCTGNAADYTAPLHQYESKSSSDGCSVTGGYVYRGQDHPDLYGHYIYVDYCSGKFWSLSRDCDSSFVNQFLIQKKPLEYSGFGEDQNGELYVAALNEGIIYKLTTTLCSGFEVCYETIDESCTQLKNGRIEL